VAAGGGDCCCDCTKAYSEIPSQCRAEIPRLSAAQAGFKRNWKSDRCKASIRHYKYTVAYQLAAEVDINDCSAARDG
jgi:hypothetical protein